MPFPSALTASQLTMTRQTRQWFDQRLLLCPNTVVWQTRPLADVNGTTPYASFSWNTTVAGDRANVKVGQTVLITTGTSLLSPIYRGRVRTAPDAATFYINETSTNLLTTYYITVIDDYDIHEKLERRLADDTEYKDWDLAYQNLPPTISGLQSTYVDAVGGATAVIAFAPTVTVNASGATISSYLWDVADGTAAPNLTTKDISVSFPGHATNEHRWVRLTATDSNGISNYFVFEVYTVSLADATPTNIKLDMGDLNITASVDEGYNATVRGWAGLTTILDRTRCAVLSIDSYNGMKRLAFTSGGAHEVLVGDTLTGATSAATCIVRAIDLTGGTWGAGTAAGYFWITDQVGTFQGENLNESTNLNVCTIAANSVYAPITQNVALVGRLRTESNRTAGDEQYAVVRDLTYTIEGFGTQLGRLVGPGLYLISDATPTSWGDIKELTIHRAILFLLAWHSTFLTVSGLTMPADAEDYQWPEFVVQENSILEWVNSVADDCNAQLVFAADGQSTIQRHASYAGVAGLTTVMTLEIDSSGLSDIVDFTLDTEYIETHAQAIAGAATYNTTTAASTAYQGRAPSQAFGPGWEKATINQQIMKDGLTDAQARTETSSRVAAHLAFVNPKPRLTGRLMPGYYWVVPMIHQLYAFDILATDTTRGKAYTSADKWLCVETNYGFNNETGVIELSATFDKVTTGGNAGILVTQVVDVNDLDLPDLPPVSAGLEPIDPLINYPSDIPDFTLPGYGSGLIQPGGESLGEPGCETLNVSMRTGGLKSTTHNTVFGATYLVTVEGDGQIDSAPWQIIRLGGYGNANLTGVTTIPCGGTEATTGTTYDSANDRYVGGNAAVGSFKIGIVGFAPGVAFTITEVSLSYNVDFTVAIARSQFVMESSGCTQPVIRTISADEINTISVAGISLTTDELYFRVSCASNTGHAYITGLRFKGTGAAPIGVVSGNYGDAFYYGYDGSDGTAILYAGSNGFRIDGAKPAAIPVYASSHSYQFLAAGTGAPFSFDYVDTDYTDNQNRNFVVTICGPGMGMT